MMGALGNGLVALDVGIASPDAVAAGCDCAQTMYRRKTEYYAAHSDTLARQNITYQPPRLLLLWSTPSPSNCRPPHSRDQTLAAARLL